MNRKLLAIIILSLLITSCAELRTKQFIVPVPPNQKEASPYSIGNWKLYPPGFVAYKSAKDLSEIKHPNTFWLTFRGEHDIIHNQPLTDTITIDSVMFDFVDNSGSVTQTEIRYPSRSSIVKNNRGSKYMAVIDFFEDQGVLIPDEIKRIKLRFTVNISGNSDNNSRNKELFVDMVRYEGEKTLPLSGWR